MMFRKFIDNENNKKIFFMLSLFMMPVVVFASSIDDNIPITAALCIEAFVSIHMSVFVLKPLAETFSPENSKKTFLLLFIIRVVILLIFDFFITPYIFIVDLLAVFVGAFIILPICAAVKNSKTKNVIDNAVDTVNQASTVIQQNVISESSPKVLVNKTDFNSIYSLNEDEMLGEIINKELSKANIDVFTNLIPSNILKRKKILNYLFIFLLFIFISLIFFHFPIYTYIIGLIILFIFYKATRKYNLLKYFIKEIKARPSEKISNIIMNVKNSLVPDNSNRLLLVGSIVAIILPLIIFMNPRIIYEKTDGGYAVRYYIFGLTNFKTAIIPETYKNEKIVSLRGNTFSNMPFLKTVVLPDSIVEIRGQAFKNCTNLENVNIPSNLVYLGGGAFYNASSIKSIELPDTLTYLGGEAFYKAKSLETIKLSNKLTEIRGNSFEYCTSLISIAIPDSVERIAAHAFYGDELLSQVTFSPKSKLREIGSSAFRECPKLKAIIISSNVNVNERAFKNSPTVIYYFSEEIIDYHNNYSNYNIPYYDSYDDLSLPYISDYKLFKGKPEILDIFDYGLRLKYYSGMLTTNYNTEAYVSGNISNPLHSSGTMYINIYFYDKNYMQLYYSKNEIELSGENESKSFYLSADNNLYALNKTSDDIYYYKIELYTFIN